MPPQWARGAFPLVFGDPSAGLLDVALPRSPAVRSRVQAYLDEGIGPLQALLLLEVPGSLPLHVGAAPGSDFDQRERWLAALAERRDGWAGVCSSNFCQPHFEGMWADVAWHREQTRLIRGR